MCGIVAILKQLSLEVPLEVVRRSAEEVTHRGPDGSGLVGLGSGVPVRDVSSANWTVGLGHTRLAIIDLSEAGSQPMCYAERYWLVYNGEIYNYLELRAELADLGHTFRSTSDSEVILAAYAEWGPGCFARFRGMWGLVLVDTVRNVVTLSRDRLGIKPLYVWNHAGMIAVTSEIKQLFRLPGFRPRADYAVMSEYLSRGFEDPTKSFFDGVVPLPPGTFMQISLDRINTGIPRSFWSPEDVRVSVTDPREAAVRWAAKFEECVRIQRRSDVTVGCALSGGLDSSAIASVFSSQRTGDDEPMHTFTATFRGDPLDERKYAEEVVRKVHGSAHFITPTPEGFLEDLDRFVWHHDEPVGSLSIYAGYCLARFTREAGVPVTLNGQGGDEIFSGYWQSYFLYLRELGLSGRFASLASHVVGSLAPDGNSTLVQQIPVMLRRYRARKTGDSRVGLRQAPDGRMGILTNALAARGQNRRVGEIRNLFLPRLLKWDDRNSMSFSVEGRYPFLDHELIDLCLSFSSETLYRRGWTKWPLRVGLREVLPKNVANRKSKNGFEVPQDLWLCGPLRPTLEKWLAADRPVWNIVERAGVRRLAEEMWRLAGARDEPGQALFRCFVLDRWLQVFGVQADLPELRPRKPERAAETTKTPHSKNDPLPDEETAAVGGAS
ncbi:MAG: asparagine synthase (glutamine-hydrolyzing) [Acidobacteriota bacterium]|nr:asparagine synthase (glutamine-hydrolyzing) [Acidobacteriota bacterium]